MLTAGDLERSQRRLESRGKEVAERARRKVSGRQRWRRLAGWLLCSRGRQSLNSDCTPACHLPHRAIPSLLQAEKERLLAARQAARQAQREEEARQRRLAQAAAEEEVGCFLITCAMTLISC